MQDLSGSNGQAAPDSNGTTGNAPANTTAGSESTAQTTGNGSGDGAGESFFDPASVVGTPLEPAYKQMQGAWTKAMQKASEYRPKVEAYDAFLRDPVNTLRSAAAQYGMTLVQAGQQETPKDFNPQNWDEVGEHFRKQFREKELEPVLNELRGIKKQNMTAYLDGHYPDWREHESSMMGMLRANPTLVNDPDALYRASVPSEVWQARAMQQAMAKLKSAGQSSQVAGGATTTRQPQQTPAGPLSFEQAVEVARQRAGSSKGIAG